jgi:hypothetical protein
MSEVITRRRLRTYAVDIAATTTGGTLLALDNYAAATVYVSGVTASAVLALYGSSDGSVFLPACRSDGTAETVTIPATGGAVSLPVTVAGLAYVKLVSTAALGSAVVTVVSLKS